MNDKKRGMQVWWLSAMCALVASRGAWGAESPLTLIDAGQSECVVVHDKSNPVEAFAVAELTEIVKGTTGVTLEANDLTDPERPATTTRILIGRNALVESVLGPELLASLKEQESLVTRRGNDLILTGGDDWGMIYAVYDFVENEMGYRCYAPYPGGEYFQKRDSLVYSGEETRTIPAFPGFRICYTSPLMFRGAISDFARFSFRNRGTQLDWERYNPWEKDKKSASFANDIGLVDKYKRHPAGGTHGLFFYVSPADRTWCFWRGTGTPALKGSFEEHPEYFTWNQHGKRVDNIQLCFSSPEMRRLFTRRVIEAIEAKGDGVYVVGSNDHSNQRYCWCPGCRAMEEKYNSVGGPLWDYMLELCETLKPDYPGVYIQTLAYKGPQQTEKAPDGVRFPANFICDAAFLNSSMTVKEIDPVTLEDGMVFDKFENLRKWVGITDHVSYWFYGGSAPYQVYERVQKEIRELRDAGVRSVGSCGLGSMEFGDITTYLYLRLLVDPDLDAKSLVAEFAAFKYGAAAPAMLAIIEELEQMRRDNLGDRSKAMYADDTYEKMSMIEAEQLVRWQQAFDEMLDVVKDDPVHSRNVRIARTAVDCWTTVFMHKIKAAYPDLALDAGAILARGRRSAEEAIAAGMLRPQNPAALKVLDDMGLYANLKEDVIPVEINAKAGENVIRYLPAQPEPWAVAKASLTEDVEAVAQWAMREVITKPETFEEGVKFQYHDSLTKTWVATGFVPKADIVPNTYQLHKLFTAYISPRSRLVFGNLWGSSLDLMKLGRYYDPTYQKRQYEFWVSLKCEGPVFDPESTAEVSTIAVEQVFLIDKGMPE